MADRVTVAEAAAILGVSEDVVRKRLQRGTLAGEKQGRTWLVTLQQDTDRTPTVGDRTRQDTSSRRQSAAIRPVVSKCSRLNSNLPENS